MTAEEKQTTEEEMKKEETSKKEGAGAEASPGEDKRWNFISFCLITLDFTFSGSSEKSEENAEDLSEEEKELLMRAGRKKTALEVLHQAEETVCRKKVKSTDHDNFLFPVGIPNLEMELWQETRIFPQDAGFGNG